jgi:hypothetical protein
MRARQDMLQFIARKPNGSPFPIARMKGTLRAASWNDMGLAAVIGDSLYVWEAGSKNIIRLLSDMGLNAAQDVVLVGPDRAVITLKSYMQEPAHRVDLQKRSLLWFDKRLK